MKKQISLLLTAVLTLSAFFCVPFNINTAAEETAEKNVIEETTGENVTDEPETDDNGTDDSLISECTTAGDAAAYIRGQLVSRNNEFSFLFTANEDFDSQSVLNEVLQYSDSAAYEGDYLRQSLKTIDFSGSGTDDNGITVTCNATYNSDAVQEQTLTAGMVNIIDEVSNNIDSNAVGLVEDYQTALAIYDYLCDNTDYVDTQAGSAEDTDILHTAYSALIPDENSEKKAECQGFALAYYRLANEMGLECRIVSGCVEQEGTQSTHSWNIVKIGDSAMYVDCASGSMNKDNGNKYMSFLFEDLSVYEKGPVYTVEYDTDDTGSLSMNTASDVADYKLNSLLTAECGENAVYTVDFNYNTVTFEPVDSEQKSVVTDTTCRYFGAKILNVYVTPGTTFDCENGIDLGGSVSLIHHDGNDAALNTYVSDNKITSHILTYVTAEESTCTVTGHKEGYKCFVCDETDGLDIFGLDEIPVNDNHTDKDDNNICDDCGTVLNADAKGVCGKTMHWAVVKNEDNSTYTLYITGEGEMNNYTSSSSSSAPWNTYSKNISEIILSDNITTIGEYAFYKCTKLSSITLPNTLTTIGQCAFIGCSALSVIKTSEEPDRTGNKLPENLTTIGKNAFNGCSKLSTINLPANLKKIYAKAFANTGISEITIPASVTTMYSGLIFSSDDGAFNGSNITKITFANDIKTIPAYACQRATKLKTVILPDNIATINTAAFKYCSSLSVIKTSEESDSTDNKLPESLTTIEIDAFNGCSKLSTINLPANLKKIHARAFANTGISEITIPASVTTMYSGLIYSSDDGAFNGSNITKITFANGIKTIPAYACQGATKLKTVILPDNIATINTAAFKYCSSLSVIKTSEESDSTDNKLPESLTTIEIDAFNGCSKLSTINLPANLKKIHARAFANTGISEITIPASVTTMYSGLIYSSDDGAFNGSNITKITFANGIKTIPAYACQGATKIKTVILPDNIATINTAAFKYCSSLSVIKTSEESDSTDNKLPESLTTIEIDAFNGCSKLSTINLPANLKKIHARAFANTGISEITIPASVTTMYSGLIYSSDDGAFNGSNITKITFANGIKTIPTYACRGATKLTTVIMPDSVTSIGSSAFYGCSGLYSIVMPAGLNQVNSNVFTNCNKLRYVYIPSTGTTIANNAFKTCSSDLIIHCSDGAEALNSSYNAKCHTVTTEEDKTIEMCSGAEAVPVLAYCAECKLYITGTGVSDGNGKEHKEVEIPAVAATCTKTGLTAGTRCEYCNKILKQQEATPALGHSVIISTEAVAPTCTSAGNTEGRICERCLTVIKSSSKITATGHKDADNDGKCDNCGDEVTSIDISVSKLFIPFSAIIRQTQKWAKIVSNLFKFAWSKNKKKK